jgi:ABC-2 type transport system permease protein
MTHFEAIQRGVLDTRDLVFFASLMLFALFATSVILKTKRAN